MKLLIEKKRVASELFVKIVVCMLKEAATASYSCKRDVPPLY